MAKSSVPIQDLRTELASGDPIRQSRALFVVLGLVSGGKDPGPGVIGTICSRVLGAPNSPPSLRITAYDVVAASTPSDAEYVHLTNAIASDLTEGTPDEVCIKALTALPSLPPTYIADLLVNSSRAGAVRARVVAMLGIGSTVSGPLKATALDVLADVLLIDRIANVCKLDANDRGRFGFSSLQEDTAVDDHDIDNFNMDTLNVDNGSMGDVVVPLKEKNVAALQKSRKVQRQSLGALVIATIETAGRGLTDEDSLVCASSCRALTCFLTSAISAYRSSASSHSEVAFPNVKENEDVDKEVLDVLQTTSTDSNNNQGGFEFRMQAGQCALQTISSAFGPALSRFRSLPVTFQPVVPPLLSTFIEAARLGEENRPLDTLPGEMNNSNSVWNQVGHIVDESAATLGGLVAGGDPTTVLAAMQALFEILSSASSSSSSSSSSSITAATLLPTATEAALAAAKAAAAGSFSEPGSFSQGRISRAAIMQSAVLRLLLRYLDVLPPVQRSDLLPHLLPAIATVPIADDRVQSLHHLWVAVLTHDWTTSSVGPAAVSMANAASRRVAQQQKRRASSQIAGFGNSPDFDKQKEIEKEKERERERERERRQRVRQIQQQQLQQLHSRTSMLQSLLSDAAVKGAVSGSAADMNPNVPYQRDPVLREELVASLLYVVLSHPQANEPSLEALSSSLGLTTSGSLSAISGASVLQSVVAAADWLASAEVALRGTKACLGWDRAQVGTTVSSSSHSGGGGGGESTSGANDPKKQSKSKSPSNKLSQEANRTPASTSSTGTTAAADLWLQLLLRCIQVGRALSRIKATYGRDSASSMMPDLPDLPDLPEDGEDGEVKGGQDEVSTVKGNEKDRLPSKSEPEELGGLAGAIDVVARYGAELEAGFQGMMLQIVGNWRALHPGVRPRALWLCASHLRLKSVVDGAWMSLADALRGLMMTNHHYNSMDPVYGTSGTASGAPGAVGGAPAGALASGRLAAFVSTSHQKSSGEDSRWSDRMLHAASVAAAAGEREEVALLALERLAALVSASFSYFTVDIVLAKPSLRKSSLAKQRTRSLLDGLAGVAGLLDALASVILTGDSERGSKVDVFDRLSRVRSVLAPIIAKRLVNDNKSSKIPKGNREGKDDSNNDGGGERPAVVVIELDDSLLGGGATGSASYPSTLTPFSSLQSTPQAARYRKLLDQLQAAALARAVKLEASSGSTAYLSSHNSKLAHSLPDPLDLSRYGLGGEEREEEEEREVVVTGSSSPISLSMSHSVDPGAQVVRLKCKVINETAEAIDGVKVTLLAGGPVAPWQRRPMTFELGCLMPNYHRPSTFEQDPDDQDQDQNRNQDKGEGEGEGGERDQGHLNANTPTSIKGGSRREVVVQWDVALRIAGFGWPRVQALLSLPVLSTDPNQSNYMSEFSVRCAPYSVSPLDLLAPPLVSLSPSEFYQRWQALPHKLGLTIHVEPKAVEQVLLSIEAAGLSCIIKNVLHNQTNLSVHAAFYGAAWTGESIAIVVSDTCDVDSNVALISSKGDNMDRTTTATTPYFATRLTLHIGSESGAIVGHLRGRESEILRRLTGGMKGVAVAAVGGSATSKHLGSNWGWATTKGEETTESRLGVGTAPSTSTSTSSSSTFPGFLRTIAMQMESRNVLQGGNSDEADEEELAEREEDEWRSVEVSALGGWRDLRKRNVALV